MQRDSYLKTAQGKKAILRVSRFYQAKFTLAPCETLCKTPCRCDLALYKLRFVFTREIGSEVHVQVLDRVSKETMGLVSL